MAYDGWMEFNGVEVINISRTTQLARALGITSVWTSPASVAWIQEALGGVGYNDITNAPWYDPNYAGSTEFAGVVPLGFPALDDSSLTREGTENTGDGGTTGTARSGRLVIVGSVAIVASTARGVDYGKRWFDRVMRDAGRNTFCSGADLRYFRYPDVDSPIAHRRDVKVTRGSTITRKTRRVCSTTWTLTFTMTADDPYEYGEEQPSLASLGGVVTGTGLAGSGSVDIVQTSCPVFDYSPVYDPLYPALIPAPQAPDFYPEGWSIAPGKTFRRYWARVPSIRLGALLSVPVFSITATEEARMVRVSIWDSLSPNNDQCDPLFSAVVSYLPPGQEFVIDGEQKAGYIWDGVSDNVRRTDGLIFAPDAYPVRWTAFTDPSQLLVTLDVFARSAEAGGGFEGGGTVRASLDLVPKSD